MRSALRDGACAVRSRERGGAVRQLAGLITRRSEVRILSPLLMKGRVLAFLVAAIIAFFIAFLIAAGWINSTHHDAFVDAGLIALAVAFLLERIP